VEAGGDEALRIFTIGHSNRSAEEFLSLLGEFGIRAVVDVRRYPSSRKFPQFDRDRLRAHLEAEGLRYVWLEGLGGRRHGSARADSPNGGLQSPGFRHYADYMGTEEFGEAVKELLAVAAEATAAILCAEALYWKCHRRLLSDYLVAQGLEVRHILGHGQTREHRLTPGAIITKDAAVIYPPLGSAGAEDLG
jgi:uncharacterized protein (DUF488 family)